MDLVTVKGFYVSWTSDPANNKIKDWNVTELKASVRVVFVFGYVLMYLQIDANRRHVDKSVVAQFWKTLDAWTMANKPWIMKA